METNNIPTAEELLVEMANEHSYETWGELMYDTNEHWQVHYTKEVMIQFAKLHVKKALEAAAENGMIHLAKDWIRKQATIHPNSLVGSINIEIDKESILNSYNSDNIK